ncbi:uncharacterized protein LOC110091802 [Dendrobium catenatum]|uniref:uncharacterized protein LOC110091802 n=1 Tax=Dendrobium catenatum TaxID=906689 RepID=UPI0009F3021E|nr:uncharacterized protein LOC110091802 [Dendrobium catenatum]
MVAIKLDMEQSYDRMCWTTLYEMMKKIGFPVKYMKLVMECIMEPRFSILINGRLSKWIMGRSGFCQGYPLSPFLLIICSQLLSNVLLQEGKDLGIKVSSRGQKVSHFLYVDDVLLLYDAKLKSIKKIKSIVSNYCGWTRERPNLQKSSMIIGRIVESRRKKKIARIMGIKVVEEFDYLGTKLSLRRLRKEDFQFSLDKSLKILNTWGNRYISLLGKLVLEKLVFCNLPLLLISHSLIPLSVLKEFKKYCRNFIWNKQDGKHGMHYVAWEELCKLRALGGSSFDCLKLRTNESNVCLESSREAKFFLKQESVGQIQLRLVEK